MRLFVAVDPGPSVRERLEQVIEALRVRSPGSKWVAGGSLHITLAFLGEIPDAEVAAVVSAVEAAASSPRAAPFTLRFGGGGTFGPARRPHILWSGVEGDLPALAALQKGVEEALSPVGYRPEERAWTPHLTLARARDKRRGDPALAGCAAELAGKALGEARIASIVLYRSDPTPAGPRYTAVACPSLKTAP